MDETEKYQQRLQAIAEKRRLQEEQERARREMEDERLRLQQLKRKSLRDQWLMESPVSPPTSPTAQDGGAPRSPLWGQETEEHIDKLPKETQLLAEEDQLKEQMEDGEPETVNAAEAAEEVVQNGGETAPGSEVVQNGGETDPGSDAIDYVVIKNLSPLLDETTVALTNGTAGGEVEANHNAVELSTSSSVEEPLAVTEGTVTTTLLGRAEGEPGLTPNTEEEAPTLVMRAERVILTDEGEEADLPPEAEEGGDGSHQQPDPQGPVAEGEALEKVVTPEADGSPSGEGRSGSSVADTPATEADEATVDEHGEGDTGANIEEEEKVLNSESGTPILEPPQSPTDAVGGAAVASVPVYSDAQPSSLTPSPGAEGGAETVPFQGEDAGGAPEGAASEQAKDASLAASPPAHTGHFQDVPLVDSQERGGAEAEPREQEPLLSQAKSPQMQVEAGPVVASSSATSAETHATRVNQGDTVCQKRKACHCCSLM